MMLWRGLTGATWTVIRGCQKTERMGTKSVRSGEKTPLFAFWIDFAESRREGLATARRFCVRTDTPMRVPTVITVVWSGPVVLAGLALARAQRTAHRLPQSRLLLWRGDSLKEASAHPAMGPSTLPQTWYTYALMSRAVNTGFARKDRPPLGWQEGDPRKGSSKTTSHAC